MNTLLKEAVVVGLSTAILGTVLSYFSMALSVKSLNVNFDYWPSVVVTEFLTGFLVHYIAEYAGINKWYCRHGNACKRN